jgi:hypothetical protein
LVVVANGGSFISQNSGTDWSWLPRSGQWACVASSLDGSRLVAVGPDWPSLGGGIYTQVVGALVARNSSMLNLTYIGNGAFFVGNVGGTVEAP